MDYSYDFQDGGEVATVLDPSVRERLAGALDYLRKDPLVERGVLLHNDLTWTPFTNIVPPPQNKSLIRMGPDDFAVMAKLMGDGNFYGWLHSHPQWAAQPSITDIAFHQFPGNMLIYSICTDTLNEFTTPHITMLEKATKKLIQGIKK